jgi:uncharacterized RDD family membrane protein YckC
MSVILKIKQSSLEVENNLKRATILIRVKAFIVDMFMIMMPILYIMTYFILPGAKEFQENDLAKFISALIYGVILIVFWMKSGQTPGYRAYNIKVVDIDNGNISLSKAIIKYIVFIFSGATIILLFVPLAQKNNITLFDKLSKTKVINL